MEHCCCPTAIVGTKLRGNCVTTVVTMHLKWDVEGALPSAGIPMGQGSPKPYGNSQPLSSLLFPQAVLCRVSML